MPVGSELLGLARLAAGLRPFLKSVITPESARGMVRQWVAARDDRFLAKLDAAVFRHARSPYRQLLLHAGCDYADVETAVRTKGLEPALRTLAEAGVFVTWEEFKGRVPAVRGSRTFHFKETDFDNPQTTAHYRTTSGGTSGAPVRVRVDLEEHGQSAPDWAVLFDAHGWMDRPLVFWTPTHTGLASRYLKCAKFGKRYTKWFAMATMSAPQDWIRSTMVHGLARWLAGLSRPELVPVDRPARVCDYLLDLVQRGSLPVVNTSPSAAARLSMEAIARGRDLRGVTFLLGAEPLTPARRRTIEESGAAAVPTYGTSESGWVGAQFPGARDVDEVHVFRDAYAVIDRPDAMDSEGRAHPILFTNLRPASAKVLVNAEIGDSAILDTDRDSWPATELGYTDRMHTIRSFRKITAWGTTFAQSDLYHVLEHVLPAKFGGSPTSFQLVEQEDERGMPRLILRASPAIGDIDEEAVRSTLLSEIGRLRSYYGFMATMISQAGALEVERREPAATARGKVLPVLTTRADQKRQEPPTSPGARP